MAWWRAVAWNQARGHSPGTEGADPSVRQEDLQGRTTLRGAQNKKGPLARAFLVPLAKSLLLLDFFSSSFGLVGDVLSGVGGSLGSVSSGGVLYAEACAALYEGAQRPLVMSFMAGMGGEAIVLKEFYWMTQKMLEAQKRGGIEKRTHWVGFEE